ncbi:interleukin-1 receptor-associated kinase 4 [Erpetoichthys calabaricus]|uniref:Interleukin-1 receptor-associated kinase 4 n=1 Tax=Erpetoichthys calabaricus TaxID=27687 RepID=A0A8C4X2I3_ERPCA|nr:interleukin-1 receptor-associated kinase 4 [Erpetoichthys calabaricus]XP_028666576.1 interleukin-1 receptor-associated kinase 4 [Erpetoichthys calabaricus]
MSKPTTPSTYVRCLKPGMFRKLADFLDPQDAWKKIAMDIKKATGEPRYNQFHIRRFEGLLAMGKSPTIELLHDWGTTNCTVSELVDILLSNHFIAPANLLIPDSVEEDQVVRPNPSFCPQESTAVFEPERQPPSPDSTSSAISNDSATGFYNFSFSEIMRFTNNFNEKPISEGGNKLGEGGFGVVFQGCFNNKMVAVKKLSAMPDYSLQELKQQFNQEIKTMMMCKHENLVEMIGFSDEGEHLCVVCTYMSNGSLLDRLACLNGTSPLCWSRRCSIALGSACGIEYLHTNKHIHRDIKSANILLDSLLVPKISDFGLTRAAAKLTSTVFTEKVVGSTAYMAPEALRGEVTAKSDFFSFGVVLLEIISGLPPVDENREPQLLLDFKVEIEDEEMTLEECVDKKMEGWNIESVEKMYLIASQCLHDNKNRRPDIKKIKDVLEELNDTC